MRYNTIRKPAMKHLFSKLVDNVSTGLRKNKSKIATQAALAVEHAADAVFAVMSSYLVMMTGIKALNDEVERLLEDFAEEFRGAINVEAFTDLVLQIKTLHAQMEKDEKEKVKRKDIRRASRQLSKAEMAVAAAKAAGDKEAVKDALVELEALRQEIAKLTGAKKRTRRAGK